MKYSLVLRGDPRQPEKGKKVFASAQSREVIDLETLAKHIKRHGCVYSVGDFQAITTILADAVAEQLRDGNQVELGKLGKFFVTLDCEGAESFEDFDPKHNIRSLRPHWAPSKEFKRLREGVHFEQNVDRKTEKANLRESAEKRREG